MEHDIVSRDEWLRARIALLAKERASTKLRDQLSAEQRALPCVKVEEDYVFDGLWGKTGCPSGEKRTGRLTLSLIGRGLETCTARAAWSKGTADFMRANWAMGEC
jgi:Bacterial protein of unknown function (DUF899)